MISSWIFVVRLTTLHLKFPHPEKNGMGRAFFPGGGGGLASGLKIYPWNRLQGERLNKDNDDETEETGEHLEIDLNNRAGSATPQHDASEDEASNSETERKPGHVSLRQYKQRRKSGKRQRRKSSSSIDAQ